MENTDINTQALDALLDLGEGFARRELIKRRQDTLQPFYHLVTQDAAQPHVVVPVSFEDTDDKMMAVAVVAGISRVVGAVAVLFVSEGWMLVLKDKEAEGVTMENAPLPSQDLKNRIEVVLLTATDGMISRQRTLRMARNRAGKVVALHRDEHPENVQTVSRMTDGIIPAKTTH